MLETLKFLLLIVENILSHFKDSWLFMENTKKLGIIPAYNTEDLLQFNTAFSSGEIIINNSQESPIIQYGVVSQSGALSWVRVDGSDSPKRSAKLSDLEYFLRERDWNLGFGRKVALSILKEEDIIVTTTTSTTPSPTTTTSTTTPSPTSSTTSPPPDFPETSTPVPPSSNEEKENILFMLLEESYPDPILTISEEELGLSSSKVAVISDTFNKKEEIDQFNSQYEALMNIKSTMTYNENSINLGSSYYYNLISTRDLEKESTVIDLLSLSDSNYTNILNLNGLISSEVGKDGKSCNLTIGIDYTVNGKVYSKEVSLDPIENNEFKSRDILINILDYVTIDYHDFCLRAFPMSLDVNECIISYCYITYYGINR